MATKTITECDICGKVKIEKIEWWHVWIDSDREFHCSTSQPVGSVVKFKDTCNKEHAVVMFERFLNYGDFETVHSVIEDMPQPHVFLKGKEK